MNAIHTMAPPPKPINARLTPLCARLITLGASKREIKKPRWWSSMKLGSKMRSLILLEEAGFWVFFFFLLVLVFGGGRSCTSVWMRLWLCKNTRRLRTIPSPTASSSITYSSSEDSFPEIKVDHCSSLSNARKGKSDSV